MCGTYHRMQDQPSVTSAKRHSQVRNSLTFNLGIKPETGPKKALEKNTRPDSRLIPRRQNINNARDSMLLEIKKRP